MNTTRETDHEFDDDIRDQADALQKAFTAGEISASVYRERLTALKARPAPEPEAPPVRYRAPATRTAVARAPKSRDTR